MHKNMLIKPYCKPSKNRALFINMPFSAIDRPALGISLLKSIALESGFKCDIAYLNLLFAEIIGKNAYDSVSGSSSNNPNDNIPYSLLAGDWVFSQWLYGRGSNNATAYIRDFLESALSQKSISTISGMRDVIPQYISLCLDRVDWSQYRIVCFTSTFEQNLASLALACILKDRFPELVIAMGGANCESDMGVALASHFPFLDLVCTGEGEIALIGVLNALLLNIDFTGVQGIVWRSEDGRLIHNCSNEHPIDLDSTPIPNFDDYFEQIHKSSLGSSVTSWIQMEGSRGCWWGEKNHCTFCGLNGENMKFRRKSPQKVADELEEHFNKYGISNFSFSDNILDHRAFSDFIPNIKKRRLPISCFFEVKSNLTEQQIRELSEAGIKSVQPGIESLSTPILRLMRKGVTASQNISFLRNARQYGIQVSWNVLYGFPGEEESEYSRQLDIFQFLTHLEPPIGISRIRLDRFSPNYIDAHKLGFHNVRPQDVYQYIYPFLEEDTSNLCYFFDYEAKDKPSIKMMKLINGMDEFVDIWRRNWSVGTLWMTEVGKGETKIFDRRFNKTRHQLRLNAIQSRVYKYLYKASSLDRILEYLSAEIPGRTFEREKLKKFLSFLVDCKFLILVDGLYLSLALHSGAERTSSTPRYAQNHKVFKDQRVTA